MKAKGCSELFTRKIALYFLNSVIPESAFASGGEIGLLPPKHRRYGYLINARN